MALAPFVFGTASSLSATGASAPPSLGARGRGSEPAAAPFAPFEFAQEAFDQLRAVFQPLSSR